MKDPLRFSGSLRLGIITLALCLGVAMSAEDKPPPDVPKKTLTPDEESQLDEVDMGFEKAYDLLRAERGDEAVKQLRDALLNLQKLVGPEDARTLKRRADVAAVLEGRRRFGEAVDEYRAIIAIRNRLLGPEDNVAMWFRNEVAYMLEAQGKVAEAVQELRAIIPQMERVLGPAKQDMLNRRRDLVRMLDSQGKTAEAEKERRAILATMQRTLGIENDDTLEEWMHLADALDRQGNSAGAEKEYRAAVAIQERGPGPEHMNTFHFRLSLAECLEKRGKLKEALAIIKRADMDAKKVGWDHVKGPPSAMPGPPLPEYPGEPRALADRKRIEAKLKKQGAGGK